MAKAKISKPKSSTKPGLPTREQIIAFITESDQPAGKREIAREFGLKGNEKIALKALLKDMSDEGLIDSAPGRAFHKMGGVPKVTVLRIVNIDGDQPVAVPDRWEAEGKPPPHVRILEKGRKSALGVGDRILARTEERGSGYVAHVMKKLQASADLVMGVIEQEESSRGPRYWVRSIDKRQRHDYLVSDIGEAKPGDLVLGEPSGRPPRQMVRVTQILGDPLAPKSFSLIAINKYGIPNHFPEEVLDDAERVSKLDLAADHREDLRGLPIIAIDPVDARDFDDAVWAAPDEDSANAGGYQAIVAIADVSFYVRPGSALDRQARKRGNSVYFPDRVVPMLPHALSSDKCSLKAGEDRAAMACHMVIDKNGQLKSWRFTRALIRIRANIPYEVAQAAMTPDDVAPEHREALDLFRGKGQHLDRLAPDGVDLVEQALRPLWDCWHLLAKARDKREPLELDLPERRVVLDDQGSIVSVAVRERLDAHRLIEDYMIAANVAAAKALEAQKAPVMYRVHEPPSREKLAALKDYLATHGINFALGQVVRPATFNRIITQIMTSDAKPQIMEQILRSQTQAYYAPQNAGHFGLALGSYAHFTSPIRRYADLLVHRSLVGAYHLEMPTPADKQVPRTTTLSGDDYTRLAVIGELISQYERRAMEAERETIDRYVAAFLAEKVGQILPTRITGVQPFGFFATVEGLGGDGLVPVSTLGIERFHYDEASQSLIGEESGDTYHSGQRLELRLAEANPLTGSLRFELPEGANHLPMRGRGPVRRDGKGPKPKMAGKYKAGPRGRPGNIRHQGRKR
ncbi:ribonuclease R [Pseudonocardia sp. TMWB2A]|uniref:ribonuclease R family protein n=1 Tax=Pseudonocardia sp. TMWB2A TaxID=687430 RepID=UPI00307D0E0D